jgi:hypothetical protein
VNLGPKPCRKPVPYRFRGAPCHPFQSILNKPFTIMCLPRLRHRRLSAVLLELPVPVVERADLARLEPSRDAVEVECVLRVLASGRRVEMFKGNLTLQIPQATVHSSLVAEAWFA